MQQTKGKSIGFPILLVVSAGIVAAFIWVLSFGLLLPLSVTIIGLSLVLSGIWTLLNRSSKTSRILASTLIGTPLVLVLVFVFRTQALHG